MGTQRYQLNKNKYLLDPEFDRLIYILESFLQRDQRNCVLLYLALFTGARAQELLNIRFADINTYDESVFIHGLKGSNDRELPLPGWLFTEVTKVQEQVKLMNSNRDIKPNDLKKLFPISYQRLVQIWQLYRPVHKKFHSLRHTFAIRLYRKTKDLRLLQVALGHRNITNTMVYADYIYSQQELRKLIL